MNIQKIVRYAVSICEDCREDGEVNLTQLEETVIADLDLDNDEFEGNDVSFLIFKELEKFDLL